MFIAYSVSRIYSRIRSPYVPGRCRMSEIREEVNVLVWNGPIDSIAAAKWTRVSPVNIDLNCKEASRRGITSCSPCGAVVLSISTVTNAVSSVSARRRDSEM